MLIRYLRIQVLVTLLWMAAAPASAEVALRFSPADTTVDVGSTVRMSLVCDDTLDIRTIELYVEFDPEVLSSVSGGPGTLFTDPGFNLFHGFELSAPNQWYGYCVVMGANDYIVSPGELFYWEFEALANGVSPVTSSSVVLVAPGSILIPDITLETTSVTVGSDLSAAPDNPWLSPVLNCYPNPFNPTTKITFSVPESGYVRLNVYGVNGRLISTLVDEFRSAGMNEVYWDGRNEKGRVQASGVYFYRIDMGLYSKVRKMTLMK